MMYRKAMIIPAIFLVDANNFGLGMNYGNRMFSQEVTKTVGGGVYWANSASVKNSFDLMLQAVAYDPNLAPDPLNTGKAQPEAGPIWEDYDLDDVKIAALLAALIDSDSIPDVEGAAKPQFEALMAANGFELAPAPLV